VQESIATVLGSHFVWQAWNESASACFR